MPSIDLEASFASVRSTSGRRVACEPFDGDDHSTVVATDAVPESFWLSKDAEFDWFDRNAVLERKESTRGNTVSSNHSNSQRFSHNFKSKSKAAALIGLPKTQKNTFCEKRRCKNIRLFPPKRPESVGKSTAQMNEPSSPKVSCIGRVRSKRSRHRKPVTKGEKNEKPVVRSEPDREEKKIGFCGGFLLLFRSNRRRCDGAAVKSEDSSVKSSSHRKKNRSKRCENVTVSDEPAGLGGMKRFVSGRRTENWCEVE